MEFWIMLPLVILCWIAMVAAVMAVMSVVIEEVSSWLAIREHNKQAYERWKKWTPPDHPSPEA